MFTRDELLSLAFDNADTLGAVDTYVYYLRRKLGKAVIDTVHGVGSRGDGASGGRRVGLGLALVTQIVRSHGGRLEVTATPGGGATSLAAHPGR